MSSLPVVAVLAVTLLFSPASSAHADPVFSLHFDNDKKIADVAPFGSVAAMRGIVGEAKYVRDASGQSLGFNNQSLILANPHTKAGKAMPRQNMTVSMWVSLDAGRQWGGLLGAVQDDGDFERGWILGYNQSTFSFALTSADKKRMTYLSGKTSFVPGRWYHVAATYDGKTMSLYVNGILDAQSTEQSGPILYPDATPFVLGGYQDDNENFPMKGRIREFQIELAALPPSAIFAQFQSHARLTQLAPAPLAPPPPLGVPSNKKVLIIGTDGTRPDKLEAANIPNIRALMNTGVYTRAETRMPTVSGPGWSSMLTGVWSGKHGVKNNAFTGKNYDRYPDFLTRLEKINPKFSTFAAADWEPLLTTLSGGPLVSDNIDVKFAFKGPEQENDQRIADAASDYLAHENVDAAFVYFGEADEMGHAHNPLSPEYAKAIEHVDKYVGQLIAAIRRRPTYVQEDWLILMSTDHGHVDKGGHGGPSEVERTIFFLANGPDADKTKLQAPVQIVDVGITALAHLGVKTDPSWNLDGKVQALK